MGNRTTMRYATCGVCGKRSRQPKLTPEQEYGWEPWFLDEMPRYSERDRVTTPEVCPYCGYSYPSIEEPGIANELDFKSVEYQDPLREDAEKIRSYGIADLMEDVKACMRAAYLMKSSDVACYRLALEEYLIAVWLLDKEIQRALAQTAEVRGKNSADSKRGIEAFTVFREQTTGTSLCDLYPKGIQEICQNVRSICLEKAIYCCNMLRKREMRNEDTVLLIELYRRRGLFDLAMAYIEEMLENEMWDSVDEKLMIRHQMELCKMKETRPATLVMGGME